MKSYALYLYWSSQSEADLTKLSSDRPGETMKTQRQQAGGNREAGRQSPP